MYCQVCSAWNDDQREACRHCHQKLLVISGAYDFEDQNAFDDHPEEQYSLDEHLLERISACTVILDGRMVTSCLVLAVEVQGKAITTIEGIASAEGLHPIQQAFLENAALQCGICTPGFIVASKALLDQEPDADEDRIRLWLAGNLCRCTGYDKIIRAVMDAGQKMKA